MLEYYSGILIMTSNRTDTIDGAFQSRINLTLHYPDLGVDAKEHVWRQLASHTPLDHADGISHDLYRRLAELPLNGRQIKNVVKIATLLAVQEDQALGREHLRVVVEATMGLNARGLQLGRGPMPLVSACITAWLVWVWKRLWPWKARR